ncbi:DNA-directed DNA polymerase alpha catalytic subunit pol1, partial [Coemansia sp. RSA 2559]
MYMKVDEDDYQSIIRKGGGALHDFVVDDDGAGYADDSVDDIGAESSFTATKSQTKLAKQRRNTPKAVASEAKAGRERTIGTLFKNAHLKAPRKSKGRAPDDEAFMASLMDDLDAPATPSARRRPANVPAATYSERRRVAGHMPMPKPVGITDISDPALDPFALPPAKKIRMDDDPFGPDLSLAVKEEEDEEQQGDVDVKPCILDDDAMELDAIGDEALEDLNDLQSLADMDVKPLYAAAEDDGGAQGKDWMAVQQEMAATHV